MASKFFPNAEMMGLVKSAADGAGACKKATNADLAKFSNATALGGITDLELKCAELTDREVEVVAEDIYWELKAKRQRYSNMYRNESGETSSRMFAIDAKALMSIYEKTRGYKRKDEVFEMVAKWLKEEADARDPAFFGTYGTPEKSEGVWVRHPRAPLDQEKMSSPTDILCGIKDLGKEQPQFLVRAGALYALTGGRVSRRKKIVVQRVGETLCIANSKYDGPLNMNSEGLQLERVLCGQPQYLKPRTDEFNEYSNKQVFVLKEMKLPAAKPNAPPKRLVTYYHAFGHSSEKNTKGRVQVDSSESPQNYKLRSGGAVKETWMQMWARQQRYLHHSEWDRQREFLVVKVPVRELPPVPRAGGAAGTAGAGGGAESAAGAGQAEVEAWPLDPEDETNNTPFEKGFIQVRIRNNNKVVRRPLRLDECLTIEALQEQAFGGEQELPALEAAIKNCLEHIAKALNAKEYGPDKTEDKWYSWAYYLDRLKLQDGYQKDDLDIFEKSIGGDADRDHPAERIVSQADRLMPDKDSLLNFKRIVWPEYGQGA